MYSPPRSLTRIDGQVAPAQQWRDLFGPDLDEVLAGPAQGSERPPPGWNFVHYDLDPQNSKMVPLCSLSAVVIPKDEARNGHADCCGVVHVVLIGETDGGEHLVTPIFKISDLGLGKTMDDPMFRRPCVHEYYLYLSPPPPFFPHL